MKHFILVYIWGLHVIRRCMLICMWILVFACSACSIGLKYPGEWSPLERQPDCVEFIGMYEEYGLSTKPGERPRLSALLLTGNALNEQNVANTAVALIARDSGEIGVKLLQGDAEMLEFEPLEKKGGLSCHRGSLMLTSRTYVPIESGTPGLFLVSERGIIFKAEDGALVFRGNAYLVGLVYSLFPVAMKVTDIWYRFPMIQTAEPNH